MTKVISQRELRNDSGQVLRDVADGESFIVTRNGVPTARLIPLGRRTEVPRDEVIAAVRGIAPMDFQRFRDDVDAVVDPWLQE